MVTLLEYVVTGFEKNPERTLSTLAEWSLCCMSALRSKDVDCKRSIHLVTAKTLETLLLNLNLDPTRPWTSVKKIEEDIKLKIERPLCEIIDKEKARNASLYADFLALKSSFYELKQENVRLQNELRERPKSWFGK